MISLVALSVYLLILGVHDLIDLLPDLVPELSVGDGGLAEYNEIIIIINDKGSTKIVIIINLIKRHNRSIQIRLK